ncbi:hypothetical protein GCM10011385_19370 [Nitratireductor aestuarii]|uniref:Tripartite tricarboxylate transporter substrate binding protein n=2 Tax=Nitratireductor aestuarii TaxID=1735103 RepID=A0A916RQ42_9HYPH|nr:hypothetical protein GCM10011385_19370 [Nitratireductor aestuarii]
MMKFDHKMSRRVFLAATALASAATLLPVSLGHAADWPSRPVTMVVPFGPGASNDIFTRQLSEVLSRDLGQPFVVENKPGAGGFTGSLAVSQATPDGYRFLELPNSVVAFGPIMGVQLDPLTDLTPIAILATSPGAMVVPADLPVNSVKEFIEYANNRSEDTFVGYVGVGATQHQMAEKFKTLTGVKLKSINYQSAAEGQTDLVAGRLQVLFSTIAGVLGQIQAGKLKVLAYTNDSYAPGSPPAPTMAEQGVEGMEGSQVWWGVFGPKGMPQDITDQMNAAINKALDDPAMVTVLTNAGAVPVKGSPADFVKAIKDEAEIVQEFVKLTGFQPKQGG